MTPSHYVDARFDSFRAMRRSQIGSRMARSYSGILVFCTKIYRISYINVTEMITSKYDMTKLFFIICRFSDKLGYFLSATVNWRRRRLAFGDYESSPIAAAPQRGASRARARGGVGSARRRSVHPARGGGGQGRGRSQCPIHHNF